MNSEGPGVGTEWGLSLHVVLSLMWSRGWAGPGSVNGIEDLLRSRFLRFIFPL